MHLRSVLASLRVTPRMGNVQPDTLTFQPVPYFANTLATGGGLVPSTVFSDTLPADRMHYWLEIFPVGGFNPTETYTLTVQVRTSTPVNIYLPLIRR